MVIDIKMCRFDNVPWGFRLVGGADYEYPLTVVKVTEGSIAEQAGLCVEDVIVRINDTAATPLTHDEAHRLILSSGSVFYFGVHRENEELVEAPRRFPLSSSSLTKSPTPPPLLSASASPLPWLTEATKAVAPEQEREQEQVEVEQQQREREQEVEQECRSAMTEMHSDGHSNGLDRQERELEQQQLEREQEREQKREQERELVRACPAVDTLYLPDLPDRPCSALSEQTEIKLVEEEIAAVLSGETEVLKEHNVLGVNFYRIFPKPGVCMTSDVLRSLNEEVTKTKLEKERENRKWSTFLQRPDRPVPKSKQQLEAERRAANAYKVKIVKSQPREKSPMPETKPAKEATPPPAPAPEQAEQEPEKEAEPEEVEEEPLPTDSEVPNLEQLPDNGNGNGDGDGDELPEEQLEKADATKDEPGEQQQEVEEEEEGEQAATAVEPNEREPEAATVVAAVAKTDEELALEKQLADVQKQLAALSSLPSTIQSTLDAVTKQLAELLPTFKLQQQEKEKEQQQGQGEQAQESPIDEQQQQQQPAAEAACENNEDKCDANDLEVAKFSLSNGDGDGDTGELDAAAAPPPQPPLPHNEEEQSFKKQKKHNVIEELEEHLVRKKHPKQRSKRAFGPLTPSSERPLVLPGGRRWYRPKDAYNDEFIAETLSAQAELITGSTLGCPYESPLLGYDARELQSRSVSAATHRVNFMKYQKPERKIDLNRSEVYKVIHHLDRAPVRGIEVRAPLVAAEEDIRQRATLQS